MTDPGSPPALATALAYHQAWTSQNLDQAMTYIADDISCDAPRVLAGFHSPRIRGRQSADHA
jgi:hypothetical protein